MQLDNLVTKVRALLHAEGQRPPEGGWEALEITGPEPVEDILLWPEGIPALEP